jgi:hypothetical protein
MSKVIFTGCSFTAGNGWVDLPPDDSEKIECKDYPNLWVNLCYNQLEQIKDLDLINYGQGGASNTEIFKNTVNAISEHQNDIDVIFCQWTYMPRYKFNVGFELWDTAESINLGGRSKFDVNLSNGTKWNRKYLDDLLDRLLVLHHAHNEIINLVTYSNILQRLVKAFSIKLYFINGLCPWDQNYFTRLNNVLPENYTPFTKNKILEINSRSDEDIFKLYNKLHNDYDNAGGINPTQWINLYSSMFNNKIDVNYDNKHPGIQSNQLYFEQIKKFFETQ